MGFVISVWASFFNYSLSLLCSPLYCALSSLRYLLHCVMSAALCFPRYLLHRVLSAVSSLRCLLHSVLSAALCFPRYLLHSVLSAALCFPRYLLHRVLSTVSSLRCLLHSVWSAAVYFLANLYPSVWNFITFYLSSPPELVRDKERTSQEKSERDKGDRVLREYIKNSEDYTHLVHVGDIGCRLQKLWYQVIDKEGQKKILTLAPVSAKCPLILDQETIKTLNKLFGILQLPSLLSIEKVFYIPESGHVITIQPLMNRGSLRDIINHSSPTSDWVDKYKMHGKTPLSPATVASYGRQILETIISLYKLGFPPVGHIQTGNIFVEGDTCRLGGYENMLLGYRPRLYRLCISFDCTDSIDIVMFGHLIYEMTCGHELTVLVPGDEDYRSVEDQEVKKVIKVIFARNKEGKFTSSIRKILTLRFFQKASLPSKVGWPDHTTLPRDVKNLLFKVVMGEPQKQLRPPKKEQDPPREDGIFQSIKSLPRDVKNLMVMWKPQKQLQSIKSWLTSHMPSTCPTHVKIMSRSCQAGD